MGEKTPLIQIAPVIERLVFPRGKKAFIAWLNKIESLKGISFLISAHYSGKVRFTRNEIGALKVKIDNSNWEKTQGDFKFLSWFDQKLLDIGIVPKNPLKKFSD